MKTLKVGIADYETMKDRTMAIARGELKPKRSDPKIWFTSMGSFARVLSEPNRALLALIVEAQPQSLTDLAELSGRAKSNLSRTLKKMEQYGLVQLRKGEAGKISPHVPYRGIVLDLPIAAKERAERPSRHA